MKYIIETSLGDMHRRFFKNFNANGLPIFVLDPKNAKHFDVEEDCFDVIDDIVGNYFSIKGALLSCVIQPY